MLQQLEEKITKKDNRLALVEKEKNRISRKREEVREML